MSLDHGAWPFFPVSGRLGVPLVGRVGESDGASSMLFQAYFDAVEAKTGKTPRALVAEAVARGYDDLSVKAGVIVQWLADEYGLGRGYAMALVQVVEKGPTIDAKHVGSGGRAQRRERHALARRRRDEAADRLTVLAPTLAPWSRTQRSP